MTTAKLWTGVGSFKIHSTLSPQLCVGIQASLYLSICKDGWCYTWREEQMGASGRTCGLGRTRVKLVLPAPSSSVRQASSDSPSKGQTLPTASKPQWVTVYVPVRLTARCWGPGKGGGDLGRKRAEQSPEDILRMDQGDFRGRRQGCCGKRATLTP